MTGEREDFITEIYAQTYQLAKDNGISHDFIMAQIIQETDWGKHILDGTYNLFNIIADSSWKGEISSHKVWKIKDEKRVWAQVRFRKYTSYKNSVKDWLKFLEERKRYIALVEWGELSAKALAHKIQDTGYINNPHYAENIIKITQGKSYLKLLAKAKEAHKVTHHIHRDKYDLESGNDSKQTMFIYDIDAYINKDSIALANSKATLDKSKYYTQDLSASQTPPWLTIAIAQAKEIHGRNEHQVDAMIRKYHKGATGSALKGADTAWCASFVSWALKESGIHNTPQSAGSRFFRDESDGKGFGKGLKPIPKGEERLGDIAVWANLDKDGNYKETGHVSFVIGKDKDGKELFLGGNQSNTLGVKHYTTEDTEHRAFVGFFRPESAVSTSTVHNLPHYASAKEANQEIIGQEIELGDSTV